MASAARIVSLLSPLDDEPEGDLCTPRQDDFARAWAETGNTSAAYRKAYNVAPETPQRVVWVSAHAVSKKSVVRRRCDEYRQTFALESMISIRELLQLEIDIATADPNEIVYVAKRCCRHCHGVGHAYQWKDEAEFVDALAQSVDDGKPSPTDAGGYGFYRGNDPVLSCPECLGDGVAETVHNDTTKLTGKARRLYAGVDYRNGTWIVKMHDQTKARENIGRMLGAYTEKLKIENVGAAAAADLSKMSEAEAARAYTALMRAG